MSALSELLTSANTTGMSARALARAAQAAGFRLNHDTAARYLRGDHGRPDEATLIALANVLDVELTQLRVAAGLPSELTEPYVPPSEASRLSRRQRLAVDEVIRAMLQPAAGADEVSERRARGDARRNAARRGKAEKPAR